MNSECMHTIITDDQYAMIRGVGRIFEMRGQIIKKTAGILP